MGEAIKRYPLPSKSVNPYYKEINIKDWIQKSHCTGRFGKKSLIPGQSLNSSMAFKCCVSYLILVPFNGGALSWFSLNVMGLILYWFHLNGGVVSSVRSSSGYHGLLRTYVHTQQPTFSNFSNSSDSKVKVKVKGPTMCYIFEKHGIQGYRI